jgi:hypothetical protein
MAASERHVLRRLQKPLCASVYFSKSMTKTPIFAWPRRRRHRELTNASQRKMFTPIGGATGPTPLPTTRRRRRAKRLSRSDCPLHGPGRLPRGTFSFLPFGPGPHSPEEDHFTAVGLDGDAAGIYFGAAPEGLFDLAFDLDGRDAWS